MKTKYAHLAFGIALVLSSSLFVMNLSAQVLGKQYISFSSLRSGNLEIYIIDTECNNLRNLTNHRIRPFRDMVTKRTRFRLCVAPRR